MRAWTRCRCTCLELSLLGDKGAALTNVCLQLFSMIFTVMVVVLASAAYYTDRGIYKEANGEDLCNGVLCTSDDTGYWRLSPITGEEEISPFQSIPQ